MLSHLIQVSSQHRAGDYPIHTKLSRLSGLPTLQSLVGRDMHNGAAFVDRHRENPRSSDGPRTAEYESWSGSDARARAESGMERRDGPIASKGKGCCRSRGQAEVEYQQAKKQAEQQAE